MLYDASIRANSSAASVWSAASLSSDGIQIALTTETNSGSTVKGHKPPADLIELSSFPSLRPELGGIKAV
jgi:hypothetical protein